MWCTGRIFSTFLEVSPSHWNPWWWLEFVASEFLGILEIFIYKLVWLTGGYRVNCFKYYTLLMNGACQTAVRALHRWHCRHRSVQYTCRPTVCGQADSTGHAMRAEARWPITVRYFVRWPFETTLPLSGNNCRRSLRLRKVIKLLKRPLIHYWCSPLN